MRSRLDIADCPEIQHDLLYKSTLTCCHRTKAMAEGYPGIPVGLDPFHQLKPPNTKPIPFSAACKQSALFFRLPANNPPLFSGFPLQPQKISKLFRKIHVQEIYSRFLRFLTAKMFRSVRLFEKKQFGVGGWFENQG